MRAVAVARKDLRELPTYFKISIVIVPLILIFVVTMLIFGSSTTDEMGELPDLPESIFPAGLDAREKSIYFAVNFMAPPFFLMLATLLPITIAADAFAGERERKTLEALLAIPLSPRDLFFGKALLPFTYGFGASLAAFLVVTTVVNFGFADVSVRMPNASWLILVFLAVPAFSLLGILVELILSTRVDRTYYAMQIGSLLILPLLVFAIGGISGILLMGPFLLLILSAGVFLLDYVLIQIGSDSLSRGL